jgi:hypothetical protein
MEGVKMADKYRLVNIVMEDKDYNNVTQLTFDFRALGKRYRDGCRISDEETLEEVIETLRHLADRLQVFYERSSSG